MSAWCGLGWAESTPRVEMTQSQKKSLILQSQENRIDHLHSETGILSPDPQFSSLFRILLVAMHERWWLLVSHRGALAYYYWLVLTDHFFDKKLMITTLTTLRCPFALLVIDNSTDQIWQVIDNYFLTTPATRTLRRPSQRWSTRTPRSRSTTDLSWTSTRTPRTRWSGPL